MAPYGSAAGVAGDPSAPAPDVMASDAEQIAKPEITTSGRRIMSNRPFDNISSQGDPIEGH